MTESLDAIARKYRTDKSTHDHGYSLIYETFFEPLRNQPIVLLELGIASGASLRLWREYFPLGTIIGVDTWRPPNGPRPADLPENVQILDCDQASAELPDLLSGWCPLDVVVDDCSHIFDQTIASVDLLFDLLKPGGLYIIEDIQPVDRDMMEEFINNMQADFSLYPSTAGRGETLAIIEKESDCAMGRV
jgi:hypothetical protein